MNDGPPVAAPEALRAHRIFSAARHDLLGTTRERPSRPDGKGDSQRHSPLPPLGVVQEEVAVLVVLVCRHYCAVGTAVRRAVDG